MRIPFDDINYVSIELCGRQQENGDTSYCHVNEDQ